MRVSKLVRDVRVILNRNAPAILTGFAVVGAGVTTWFAAKGGYKSSSVIAVKEAEATRNLTTQEKFIHTYKYYAPAAVSLVGTTTCMIMATKIGLDRTAAVAGAFVAAERANDQYREKVKELLGKNKHVKIQDEVAKDVLEKTNIPANFQVGEGKQVFVDAWTGRPLPLSMEELNRAVNDINYELMHEGYASLSEFYNRIGLDHTQESDSIGWNSDHLLEVQTTPIMQNDRAVVVFTFDTKPSANFHTWR